MWKLQQVDKMISEGDYTEQQIFNVQETALCQNKRSCRIFKARKEKSMPGLKASKDRLTLFSGANATGDLKLKPVLIYHAENPMALKNYAH